MSSDQPYPGFRERERLAVDPVPANAGAVEQECPCSTPGCSNTWGMTKAGFDSYISFCKLLRARGETPLTYAEIGKCESCERAAQKEAATRAQERADRTAKAVRILRGLEAGDRANAELWLQRQLGVQYVRDLLQQVELKATAAKPRRMNGDF